MLRPYNWCRSVKQKNEIAIFTEGNLQDTRGVVENAEDADDGRGIDRFAERLVVEADVSAGDGRAEGGAGFSDAVNHLGKLPHHFGFFRTAEVEAIRGGDGARAARGDVASGFSDGVHRADARIQLAPATVAIGGKRKRTLYDARLRILDAYNRCVAVARACQSVCSHGRVVLLGDPALRGNRGRRQQLDEILREAGAFGSKCEPVFF